MVRVTEADLVDIEELEIQLRERERGRERGKRGVPLPGEGKRELIDKVYVTVWQTA